MNETTTPVCIIINDLMELTPYHRYTIASFYIILGIIGTLLNIIPAYIVIKTKQQKNPSSRLAFYLSVSDLLRASFGFCVFGLLVLWYKKVEMLKCWQRQLIILPFVIFSMSSGYLQCLIILDRFLRIAFIQNYRTIFTNRRFAMLMLVYVLVVILQFALMVLGDFHLDVHMGGVIYTTPLNLVLFFSSIVLHLKSIRQLSIHQRTICLTLGSRNILKLATIYLVIFLVFYGPVICVLILVLFGKYLNLTDHTLLQLVDVTLAIASFSCPINAVAFVVKNIKARKVIRKQYNRMRNTKKLFRRSNRVTTSTRVVSTTKPSQNNQSTNN